MVGLKYEFTLSATLKEGINVGAGPFGNRVVVEVTGGEVEGERLSGKVLSGGGDWLLVGSDGWGRLDVRLQVITNDGAALFVQYLGVLEMTPKIQQALGDPNTGTDYGDHYFRTTPRLETGDPRYAWVNHSMFVGEGHLRAGRIVEYKVYRVT